MLTLQLAHQGRLKSTLFNKRSQRSRKRRRWNVHAHVRRLQSGLALFAANCWDTDQAEAAAILASSVFRLADVDPVNF